MTSSRSKPGLVTGIILIVLALLFLYLMIVGALSGRDLLNTFLPNSILLTLGGITLLIRSLRPPVSLMDTRLFTLLDGLILGIAFFFLGLNVYSILSRGIMRQGYLHVISLAIFFAVAIVLMKFGFSSPREPQKKQGRFTVKLLEKLEL